MTEIDPDADSPPAPDDSDRSASEDSISSDASASLDLGGPDRGDPDFGGSDFGDTGDDGWELVEDERSANEVTDVTSEEESEPGDEPNPEPNPDPDRVTNSGADPAPDATSDREADGATGGDPDPDRSNRRRVIAPIMMGLVLVLGLGWLLSTCGGDEADPEAVVIVTVLPPDLSKVTVLERSVLVDARAAVAGAGYEAVIVTADGATIVLEGAVRSDDDVTTAAQAARSASGVEHVDNRLVLVAADDSVQTAAMRALLRDGYDRVQVTVVGGEATLTGSVDAENDVAAVQATVGAVDGVKSVASSVVVAAASAGSTPESIVLLADLEALFAASPILFEPAEAIITEESKTTLDSAAELIGAANLVLEVGGHTDSAGQERANQLLSEKRAQAVKGYLIAKGVEPDQLDAVGYGQSEPIADNSTEEGRAANRRIVFRAIDS